MNHNFIAELDALWERYNRVRALGSKKLRKQAESILNTYIECLQKLTPDVLAVYAEHLCTKTLDVLANAPDDYWLNGYWLFSPAGEEWWKEHGSKLPNPSFVPIRDTLMPELLRRFNTRDALATRWLGQITTTLDKSICEKLDLPWPETDGLFFLEKSYTMQKDQLTLRLIVQRQMIFLLPRRLKMNLGK